MNEFEKNMEDIFDIDVAPIEKTTEMITQANSEQSIWSSDCCKARQRLSEFLDDRRAQEFTSYGSEGLGFESLRARFT